MVKKLRGDLAGLPVRLVEVGKMNVRMKGDKEDCGITGIDVTPDGNILLADAYNDNVKQFSRSGELLSHCSDIVEPVKVFSTSEAAFIHPLFRPKILIVNLTNANRMSVHGFITIKERQSIDDVMLCSDTNFIFGCCKKGGYSVKRIDMHGKEIWTKVISVTGRCHLTRQSSDTGDRVIIADYKKERLLVLAADTGAELIVHPTKQAPRLVTSDDGGRVYVYYNETGELVVLSADLKVERSLGYGMRELEPEAIVCDRKCGELLVSSRTITHRNHLYRFRIEKMSDSF